MITPLAMMTFLIIPVGVFIIGVLVLFGIDTYNLFKNRRR